MSDEDTQDDAPQEGAATEGEGAEGEGKKGFDAKKIVLFVVLPLLILIGVAGGLYFTGFLDPYLNPPKARSMPTKNTLRRNMPPLPMIMVVVMAMAMAVPVAPLSRFLQ